MTKTAGSAFINAFRQRSMCSPDRMDPTNEIRNRDLRRDGLMAAASEEHPSDAELLHLFVERRDEQAITALVARHGPLVMGLCRNMLRNEQDAADAFQATFLVLLKRAAAIRKPASLSSWLHGVACRVALRARSDSKRRQKHERLKSDRTPEAFCVQPERGETITLIHLELQKLPERLRLPLILCCLEGVSREEAARRLGWTVGSLKGRLERGREMLRLRLARHGLIFSAGALSTLLAEQASAEVSATVASFTIKLTMLVGGGQSLAGHVIHNQSILLTQGVLKAMLVTKLKVIAAFFVLGGGVVSAAWAYFGDRDSRHEEPQRIIVHDDAAVMDLAWSADSSAVATISTTFEFFEPAPQTPLQGDAQKLIEAESPKPPTKIMNSHSNVKFWDAKTGELLKDANRAELLKSVGEEISHISAIAFSPDKNHAAIAGGNKIIGKGRPQLFVKLFDTQTWRVLQEIHDDDAYGVNALAFSPDGKTLAIGGMHPSAEDGSFVRLWDIVADQITSPTKFAPKNLGLGNAVVVKPTGPAWAVGHLSFSADGTLLASGEFAMRSHRARVRLCDAATGVLKREWDLGESKGPVSIAFADGGKTLVSACRAVKFWDVQTGNELRTLNSQGWESIRIDTSPDGRYVAAAALRKKGDDVTVHWATLLWDSQTGELKQTLRWNNAGTFTTSLAFSPNGRSLAVGGQTGFPDAQVEGSEKVTGELKVITLD